MISSLFSHIISDAALHAKWLNTLSYLENCGARKIAKCEHPTLVQEEMLKHAAEEFRHAHFLKTQINKISDTPPPDYKIPHLLGGMATLHYLNALDLRLLRQLRQLDLPSLAKAAYLLVTFAIEQRALKLYPLYHEALLAAKSPVRVKSILLEEEEHLDAMKREIEKLQYGPKLSAIATQLETQLYQQWIQAVYRDAYTIYEI
jgi:hypothetical protein